MKILISADLEGVNGVVSPKDIIPGEAGYETARVLMTEEVNSVVCGALAAGADQVIVCDAHEDAQNLRFDLLDERAWLIRGETRNDSMVHGIDATFDGLILLGYHAMFGTQKAVLDHSYDQRLIRSLEVNGVPYGEAGVNGLLAAEHGVPLLMATGDDALEREMKSFDENVDVAVVKYAQGRYCARCLPQRESTGLLFDMAVKAVKDAPSKVCKPVPEQITMGVTFQQTCMADGAMRVKGVRRNGAMSVLYPCTSMQEYMEMRQIIFQAAAEFYDSRF